MRYLGIDYGSKRVGVAISDETNSYAFPLVVLESQENLVKKLTEICQTNNITEIIVGESRDYSQNENQIMKEITPFVESLTKETSLPVHQHPEFLTSQEAERLQGKNDMHDASAAAIILKSFLDTKNNSL